jgi:heat shock protein HtpX
MWNTLKVGALLAVLTALFVGIGHLIGGQSGMIIALVLAVAMNFGSFWFSDKIVLKMTGAQPLDRRQAPALYEMTERLAQRAGLPMPALYVIDDPQPNAFATGRGPSNSAVAVNRGLLEVLNQREVEGVVAHEIAHIKHRDTLTMTLVATFAGAIMMLAQIGQFAAMFGGLGGGDDEEGGTNLGGMLVAIFVAPLAATIIQLAVSRAREFEADATAARLTGSPVGLASALAKLEGATHAIPSHSQRPQTAHLCIAAPFAGGTGQFLAGLFSTHPPMAARIARLQQMREGAAP